MSAKQDRQGVRTPADVEQKYNLGRTLNEIELLLDAHRAAQQKVTDAANAIGTDIAALRKDFNESIQEFWQTSAELRKEAEDMQADMEITKQEFTASADSLAADILALTGEIEPLAEWTDGTRSGVAGFVAKADENSATIANIVKWATEDGGNVSVAAIKQYVAENYATLDMLALHKTETSQTIAGIRADVSDGLAEIESLTTITEGNSEAIAGIRQSVTEMGARIDTLVSLESELSGSLAGVSSLVSENNARVDSLASTTNGLNESIAGIRQGVSDNAAAIRQVASVSSENASALAGLESEVETYYAKQTMVTSVDTRLSNAISGLATEVATNYAKTEQLSALETATSQQFAALRTEVAEDYASVDMIADVLDEKTGKISTAAIIAAVNDGTSEVKISADKINFEGSAIFKGLEDGTTSIDGACIKTGKISADRIDVGELFADYVKVGDLEDGTTTIDGACIKSGYIQSANYETDAYGEVISGMRISLDTGYISSKYFKVNVSGGVNAYGTIRGNIIAETGEIGGFSVSSSGLDKTFSTESNGNTFTTSIRVNNNGFQAVNEHHASGVLLTKHQTDIMPGAINIAYTNHTANYTGFDGTFLCYTENGTTYYAYIDPVTKTVKVR